MPLMGSERNVRARTTAELTWYLPLMAPLVVTYNGSSHATYVVQAGSYGRFVGQIRLTQADPGQIGQHPCLIIRRMRCLLELKHLFDIKGDRAQAFLDQRLDKLYLSHGYQPAGGKLDCFAVRPL